jgi:hypothetical protein
MTTEERIENPEKGLASTRESGRATSRLAVVSLIFGILSVLLLPVFAGLLLAIPAIVCGGFGEKEVAQSGGRLGGAMTARAGSVLGWITVLLGVLGGAVAIGIYLSAHAH